MDHPPPSRTTPADMSVGMRRLYRAIFVLSALLGLCGLVGLLAGVAGPPKPALAYIAFQGVILAAAIFGLLMGRGRFRGDAPMTLLCVGGVALAAAAFGFVSLGPVRTLGPVPIIPLTGVALLISAILLALSGLSVLDKRRESWVKLLIGAALALPVLGATAVLITGQPKAAVDAMNSVTGPLKVILAMVGGIVFIALASASGHLIIRAFQTALDAPARPGDTQGR